MNYANIITYDFTHKTLSKYLESVFYEVDSVLTTSREYGSILDKVNTDTVLAKEFFDVCVGMRTGCNDAFVISKNLAEDFMLKDSNTAEVIHPAIWGRCLLHFTYTFDNYVIALPVKEDPIDKYPVLYNHLIPYKKRLEARYARSEWYNLEFNVPLARVLPDSQPLVVIPEILTWNRNLRDFTSSAVFKPINNHLTMNSCWAVSGEEEYLKYFQALLNTRLYKCLLLNSCSPFGGFSRGIRKNILLFLPIKFPTQDVLRAIVPIIDKLNSPLYKNNLELLSELNNFVNDMYKLSRRDIQYLNEVNI